MELEIQLEKWGTCYLYPIPEKKDWYEFIPGGASYWYYMPPEERHELPDGYELNMAKDIAKEVEGIRDWWFDEKRTYWNGSDTWVFVFSESNKN